MSEDRRVNHEATCQGCAYYDSKCGNTESEYYGEELDPRSVVCIDYMRKRRNVQETGITPQEAMEVMKAIKAPTLSQSVDQLGQYLGQMGRMVSAMQRRMDELEARQAAVTIRHEDVKRLQGQIRYRADELCRKHNLQDKDSPRILRAAIKKDVLARYQVKDLHDVPAAGLSGAEHQVNSWTNIRLLMERRVST